MYYTPNYKGEEIYLRRQVDEFSISCVNIDIANEIIAQNDSHMAFKVKALGIIDRVNAINVHQTCHYTKINNAIYTHKILDDKKCITSLSHQKTLPMSNDPRYNREISRLIHHSTMMNYTTLKRNMVSVIDNALVNLFAPWSPVDQPYHPPS